MMPFLFGAAGGAGAAGAGAGGAGAAAAGGAGASAGIAGGAGMGAAAGGAAGSGLGGVTGGALSSGSGLAGLSSKFKGLFDEQSKKSYMEALQKGGKAALGKAMEPGPALPPGTLNPNFGQGRSESSDDQIAMILQRLFGGQ